MHFTGPVDERWKHKNMQKTMNSEITEKQNLAQDTSK